ncbi:hypothetical protein EG344_00065 [Chryseobacterium sp. G0162]|uniref:hypothetical protein n=1 Tax=Chryseobacterium sp. G0162 TaxID=2487063 RepID=UPI000F4F6424|nr:hypothetical protein [Chryseobacterium sp. G0162]AZB07345.1 hypothetical protein EG344_00065 [Chryseobacterium sp. G0162]
MKTTLAFSFILLNFSLLFAQVGIYTNDPTQTLDVNGSSRIRTLDTPTSTSYDTRIIMAETDGTLKRISIEDLIFSSGLYVRSNPNNTWNNILLGGKGGRLTFVGRVSESAIDFTFSLFIDKNQSITVIDKTPSTFNITVNSPTNFTVSSGSFTYTFNIVYNSDGNHANITATTNATWIQGTFQSVPWS